MQIISTKVLVFVYVNLNGMITENKTSDIKINNFLSRVPW